MLQVQKPLVAVVDDEELKRQCIQKYIECMGCEVKGFDSGEDFLANANRETACVILNEVMPGFNGSEVFHQMRSEGWCIPVISEGVGFSKEEALERYSGGQVAHLVAPFKLADLGDAIRKGLLAAGYCLPPKGLIEFDLALLTWNGGAIPQLARSILEEGAVQSLPILGDALEEGGCTNSDILNHCRNPDEHSRGCWVVDRILALLQPDSRFNALVCRKCERQLRVPNHLGEIQVRCVKCNHCFFWDGDFSVLFPDFFKTSDPGPQQEWDYQGNIDAWHDDR